MGLPAAGHGTLHILGPLILLDLQKKGSGNALVSINAVALHRAQLVLGWVTAFEQVNSLIT